MNNAVIDWLRHIDFQKYFILDSLERRPEASDFSSHEYVVCTVGPLVRISTALFWMQEAGYELDSQMTRQCREIAFIADDNIFYIRGHVFRKRKDVADVDDNAVVTWISGDDPSFQKGVHVFLDSLHEVNPHCQKFAITNNMSLAMREKVESYRFTVVESCTQEPFNLLLDRHVNFHRLLSQKGNSFKTVLLCDSRDVVFQRDPFKWMKSYVDDDSRFVLACSEGKSHHQCEWNTKDQEKLQQGLNVYVDFSDWPVLNGGVLFGTPQELSLLCSKIYKLTSTSYESNRFCTDQASLNYIFQGNRQWGNNTKTKMLTVGPLEHNLAAHGDSIKTGTFEAKYHFEDDILYHDHSNEPFVLFHQWDRTSFRNTIYNKYKQPS